MVSEPAGRPSGGVAQPHPDSHAVPEAPLATAASKGNSTSHLPAWVTNDRKVLHHTTLYTNAIVFGGTTPNGPCCRLSALGRP